MEKYYKYAQSGVPPDPTNSAGPVNSTMGAYPIKMTMFFLTFSVAPTLGNTHYEQVKGAFASCWLEEQDEQAALTKASFYVTKDDWEIKAIESNPISVSIENFDGKDIGEEYFRKAQENGISICYTGWSRDGKSSMPMTETTPSYKFDIGKFLKEQKELINSGTCLHHDSKEDCKKIISAHSIQKNQALSAIAIDGHVYMRSTDYSAIKKHKGKPSFKKVGVNKASTFLGFCEKHDNTLFEPIDKRLLVPTDQQIMLYAYRSLCRELFVKRNSVKLYNNQRQEKGITQGIRDLFEGMYQGSKFGLKNLYRQKSFYDTSFKKESYQDVSYVLFSLSQKPNIAFSGLLFPDYDFLGRKLQNLGDHSQDMELITFCSAPTREGWGYLFAWHSNNSQICEAFMCSLATKMHEGEKLADMLFRLVMLCCENLAISPDWWEALSIKQTDEIIDIITPYNSPFSAVKNSYLLKGLKGIVNWEIDTVLTTME